MKDIFFNVMYVAGALFFAYVAIACIKAIISEFTD